MRTEPGEIRSNALLLPLLPLLRISLFRLCRVRILRERADSRQSPTFKCSPESHTCADGLFAREQKFQCFVFDGDLDRSIGGEFDGVVVDAHLAG